MLEYLKQIRIVSPEIISYVKRKRDGTCLVGLYRPVKYGECSNRRVEELDVHHIDTRGSGGADDEHNLITLCRKHHNMAGAGLISKEELLEILDEMYADVRSIYE